MWSSMGQQGLELKPLTQQDAGDLFGYFYSIRFFDKAADAARGKRLFTSNHCSECHAISESAGGVAKPVANWQSLGHPIELASAMWRHSTNMRQAFAAKGFDWPTLSGQDLSRHSSLRAQSACDTREANRIYGDWRERKIAIRFQRVRKVPHGQPRPGSPIEG